MRRSETAPEMIGKSSIANCNDFAAKCASVHDQPPHADRQLEAPRSGAAGVEIQHSGARFLFRDVAVARDYHAETGRLGFQIQSAQVVQHIHRNAADFEDFGLRQSLGPRTVIDVAAYRDNRSDLRQPIENRGIAHVAGMDDAL